MNKERLDQLELFSQTEGHGQAKIRASGTFRTRISKHEKTILIIIGFAVTSIASFSLGVEKGKKLIALNTGTKLDIAAKPAPAPSSAPQANQVTQDEEYQVKDYTIQVASFLNKTNAEKEASTLKRKGLSPLVLSKGKFSIVCVGSFSKKEEAESFLPKIRKQYQDCRIRRL